MPTVQFADRAVVLVSGPYAQPFLQNVVTTDLTALAEGEAWPGALLTPQGKILFDFLVSRRGADQFRLDCRRDAAADFMKRLMLYRLRAKADISLLEEEVIAASWETDSAASQTDSTVRDRRFPDTPAVLRHYGGVFPADSDVEAWNRLRIAHGVAESGADYALGEIFPHDVLFDQNNGIGLKKGCYVGQEVVSRMHHRGTARRRLVIVQGEAPLPPSGTELAAGGRPLGTLGTVSGRDGLAIVRIDRVAEARAAGIPIVAGDVSVAPRVPAYARFSLSETGSQAGTD